MARARARAARLRTSIDRRSPIPFYVQLKQALTDAIHNGLWAPGDRIPSEPELCQSFGVSRTVVRQALTELTYEGVVVREKGKGTFVAEPKISSASLVHSLVGFYEDMAERGQAPVTQVLEQVIEPAGPKLATNLKLEPMTPVIKLVRLRFVGDEPIVLVTSYLPYELCPKLVKADLAHQSLYAFLKQEYGLSLASGRRRIDTVQATESEARLLQIEKAAPLLRLESISYLEDGTPLEYFHGAFRGDRTRFEVEIDRRRGRSRTRETTAFSEEDAWLP
ncbi:MAG: GntR family transcriptional regulator [Anaerolineales bacterium]|jgi:GntR family transcriptional regulator